MRNFKSIGAVAGIAIAALLTGAANGQTWAEQGDAPSLLPGQETQGAGPLTSITGTAQGGDVDLYKITITDPSQFSISACGQVSWDTQLFLFDSNGNGVTHMDDACGLQSALTNTFVSQAGVYYVAISAYNNDPESPNGLIWANSPFNVERQPDGPGAPGPLSNWSASSPTGGSYALTLTGCSFGNAGGFFISLTGQCPGQKTLAWTGAGAGQMGIILGSGPGNFTIPGGPCQGTQLGLSGPGGLQLYTIIGTNGGQGQVNATVGTGACGKWVQCIKTNDCSTSNATGPI